MAFGTSEVLDKFKGLTRELLYYMEKAGFINPTKLTRGKLDKRLYSEEDLEKIGLIWQYYQRGISPKEACKKAEEQLESDVSPAQIRLKEAIERAHAKGVELSGMTLEAVTGTFHNGDDAVMEDLTRVIEHVIKKQADGGAKE